MGFQLANTMATKDSDVKYIEIGTLANRIYTNAKIMAIDSDRVRVYNSSINGNSCAVESGDQAIHVRADGWFDIRTNHGLTFQNDGNSLFTSVAFVMVLQWLKVIVLKWMTSIWCRINAVNTI